MSGDHWLKIRDEGPVRHLVLDRPERKNAVPPHGWADLHEAFDGFDESALRVLVVRGTGGDFCSGADLEGDGFERSHGGAAAAFAWMQHVGAAAKRLHRISKPTVAAVDGIAAGAGMNLALGCDVVIASDRARFSEIFVRRGLTVDFGGTWLLPRLVGRARALELALTGRIVGAAEALEMGLVAQVVPVAGLAEAVEAMAAELAAGAPVAQRMIKLALDRAEAASFEETVDLEDQLQAILLTTDDVREGVASFLEKRPPRFEGR